MPLLRRPIISQTIIDSLQQTASTYPQDTDKLQKDANKKEGTSVCPSFLLLSYQDHLTATLTSIVARYSLPSV